MLVPAVRRIAVHLAEAPPPPGSPLPPPSQHTRLLHHPMRAAVLAIGGVGGLAVGLAGREILENLFTGLIILSSNPFEVRWQAPLGAGGGRPAGWHACWWRQPGGCWAARLAEANPACYGLRWAWGRGRRRRGRGCRGGAGAALPARRRACLHFVRGLPAVQGWFGGGPAAARRPPPTPPLLAHPTHPPTHPLPSPWAAGGG